MLVGEMARTVPRRLLFFCSGDPGVGKTYLRFGAQCTE